MATLRIPRQPLFWAVGAGHLVNDIFMSMGVVVLTFLSATIVPMSNAQIGFAVSATQLVGAVSQPFLGLRADRTGGRWLGAGGLLWVVSMMLLTLLLATTTRSYGLMVVPYILMGLGSGAVHPVGSLHAAEADKQQVATNVAYFFLMGQIGLALGPTLAGLLLDAANVFWLAPYLQAPGVGALAFRAGNVMPLFGLALLAILPVTLMATRIPQRHKAKLQASGLDWRALPFVPLLALATMVIFRGLAQPGSVNFIPVLFQQKGWSPSEYGLITSSFWIAAGVAGVLMGTLADRYDRRHIVLWTMVASAPSFFLLPHLEGPLAFMAAILAGGLSGGTHSMLVVLAQELIPGGKAFASGAMLGFIFGTGALGSLVIGSLADAIGLADTFHWVAAAAAFSGLLALALPKRA